MRLSKIVKFDISNRGNGRFDGILSYKDAHKQLIFSAVPKCKKEKYDIMISQRSDYISEEVYKFVHQSQVECDVQDIKDFCHQIVDELYNYYPKFYKM